MTGEKNCTENVPNPSPRSACPFGDNSKWSVSFLRTSLGWMLFHFGWLLADQIRMLTSPRSSECIFNMYIGASVLTYSWSLLYKGLLLVLKSVAARVQRDFYRKCLFQMWDLSRAWECRLVSLLSVVLWVSRNSASSFLTGHLWKLRALS